MPESLASSISHSLNSLPNPLLVIDSNGCILFANLRFNEYNHLYGFSPTAECIGVRVLELFQERIAAPAMVTILNEALQDIIQGKRLTLSAELIIQTANQGSRVFRMETFPLLTEVYAEGRTVVLSLQDVGTAAERQHIQPVRNSNPLRLGKTSHNLVPICASCKSVRNTKEEWITIERFLQQQLSLQFTHDICPDCIRQLYPKYAGALNFQRS